MQYVEMLAQGLINPRPRIRTVREPAAVGGDNGLAMEKAEVGTGWVARGNRNHWLSGNLAQSINRLLQ